MRISTVPAVTLLLVACAANPPRDEVGYQPTAPSQLPTAAAVFASSTANEDAERIVPTQIGPATEVVASPDDGAITGVVCEVRERPGSRIKQKVCMTREAHVAIREAAKGQLAVAQREQEWLDEKIRENEMNAHRGLPPGP